MVLVAWPLTQLGGRRVIVSGAAGGGQCHRIGRVGHRGRHGR